MKKTKPKKRELTKALLETYDGMRRVGILSDAAHAKITKRHLGGAIVHEIKPLSPVEIRSIREEANMSQAVFAHCLRVTTGYVSQLERGTKHSERTCACASRCDQAEGDRSPLVSGRLIGGS